jgi:MarR family 2-MHQ and catechol resistance regulon transcriptional repressor
MTPAIDRLEQRGLVRRSRSPDDRRARRIELTDDGRAFITRLYAHHVEDLERIASELSAEERRVLYDALKKMGLAARVATAPRRPAEP